jgi:pimeloyl-ACP methyl ester carboxylesterase
MFTVTTGALPAGHWLSAPRLPTLYLHRTDDGCSEDYTPWIERVLPDESELALVENAGHFLQLDQRCCRAAHRRLRGTGLMSEFGVVGLRLFQPVMVARDKRQQ